MSICVDASRAARELTSAGRAAIVLCELPEASPTPFGGEGSGEDHKHRIACWRANPELEILDGKSERVKLTGLSNEQLLSDLHAFIGQGRKVLAGLLAYLGEVEQRRLDLESACSSLFDFCVRRLGMGEDEACRRVAGARLVRRFPVALTMIERGEIHLTALLLLREHLTDDNHQELVRAASGKSKCEVQHLLAERFPRPDAPSRLQMLPDTASQASLPASGEKVLTTSATVGPRPSRIAPLSPRQRRQRGHDVEVALRALCGLGFKDREARRALALVEQRLPNVRPPPMETLLREALSVLAPALAAAE